MDERKERDRKKEVGKKKRDKYIDRRMTEREEGRIEKGSTEKKAWNRNKREEWTERKVQKERRGLERKDRDRKKGEEQK